ncbi:MAG TPA: hypothetical protein VMI33_22880 [Streptosporangiaceae bacterium]|nr:hypothetical protein [Streptosporangiaceae bacterium]
MVTRSGSTSWLENELTRVSRQRARVAATFSRRSPPSLLPVPGGPWITRLRPDSTAAMAVRWESASRTE